MLSLIAELRREDWAEDPRTRRGACARSPAVAAMVLRFFCLPVFEIDQRFAAPLFIDNRMCGWRGWPGGGLPRTYLPALQQEGVQPPTLQGLQHTRQGRRTQAYCAPGEPGAQQKLVQGLGVQRGAVLPPVPDPPTPAQWRRTPILPGAMLCTPKRPHQWRCAGSHPSSVVSRHGLHELSPE